MNLERAKELLNSVIDHFYVSEKSSDVIRKLLRIGFTEEELTNEFDFSKQDIAEATDDPEFDKY